MNEITVTVQVPQILNIEYSAPVDTALSDSSVNAVQNKVIKAEFDLKQDKILDLSDIRTGAGLGASALQASALVTALDGQSTDAQVPSAKCVYDLIGDIETLLSGV